MKRLFEIILLFILSLMLLSLGYEGKNIRIELNVNALQAKDYDSANINRLVRIERFKLALFPPSSGVQFYKDKIIFLSLSKNERKMSPNQISFGAVEAYYASVEDSATGRHQIFSPLSSFSYPCEAMTFSRDYNTVYFTKISKKDRKEKIFMGKITPNSTNQTRLVSDMMPLDFCVDNYSYSHPALSSDENILIFASDREGSYGGMDLFVTKKEGDKWSFPENLGKYINSAGNEFFPFLDSENNLFFSSDGLPGYGGYDIFTSKFNGVDWEKPVNLSAVINSEKDDIAFTINKMDGKIAFFTRREKTGNGEMQLFKISLKEDPGYHNLMTLSLIFNGKSSVKTSLLTENQVEEVKPPIVEPIKVKPETEVIKKEEVKAPEAIVDFKKPPGEKTPVKPQPEVNPAKTKTDTIKTTVPIPVEEKTVITYRIQLLLSTSQKSSMEIKINGKSYPLYKYFYLGENRYTIGAFSTLQPAVELQRICRQSGYPQSFVIAFKNNVRSLDPKLFK
ncbi:MAG TPA: hypothetical protein VF346_02220 [Bacteroidales bacterium]